MLSNHIKDLLNTDGRIIVPNLGAFMLKGSPKPTLYFNEFLRYNDGILIDFIADKEHIDKNAASDKVNHFVDSINQQLATTKSAELEGLGVLFVDNNDKIQVKTGGQKPSKPEAPIQAKKAVQVEKAPVQVEKEPIQVEKDPAPREVYFEIEKTDISSPKTEMAAPKAPEKTTVQPIETSQVKPKGSETSSQNKIQETPPIPAKTVTLNQQTQPAQQKPSMQPQQTVHPKAPAQFQASRKKSKKGWIIIILLLFVGAGVYFAKYNPVWKKFNVLKNITIGKLISKDNPVVANDSVINPAKGNAEEKPDVNTEENNKESVATKNVAESKVQTKKAVSKTEIATSVVSEGGKKYYLIAGCFSVEANADKMVEKLKTEGFDAQKLAISKINMFYVSYSSYSDRASAAQEMEKLKAADKENIWIYSN
jgi:nucleoid DNA-binding protein